MHGTFTDLAGRELDFDLDNVEIVARGQSGLRRGWPAMLVYCPTHQTFIELRNSPPTIRGDRLDEASEVESKYALDNFGVDLSKWKVQSQARVAD